MPSYVTEETEQDTVVVDVALSIVKPDWSDDGEWFASPWKLADTDTDPASVFGEYCTSSDCDKPPAPVTCAEHGVCAEPLYVTEEDEQVTVVVDVALSIAKPEASEEP